MGVGHFLLLSCLGFAVHVQAQNCSRPLPGPNMHIRGNDILREMFPDGAKVYFACAVGYQSAGGSPVITCNAGSWSTVRLKCEKKSCGSVGEVTNGRIDYQHGAEFGDKAVITCDPGYILVGRGDMICEDHGWSGRLPVCEEVACDPPPPIVDGTIRPDKDVYSYRDVVRYTCKNHYTLIGSNSRTCSEDGTFKPDAPKCVSKSCSRPVPQPNVSLKGNSSLLQTFPHGTSVSFACDVGYKAAGGSEVITCSFGEWSSVGLICQRKNCGSAGEVTNGRVVYPEGTEFGHKAQITCDTGYKLVGKDEIICEDQGWSGRLPVCEVVTCDPPPQIVDGTISPANEVYSYKDVLQYTCKNHYKLVGSKSRTCSEDGTFTPDAPTCALIQCEEPPVANAGWIRNPPYKPGSAVRFQCSTGYTLQGQQTQTCDKDGRWSPGLPTCELIHCEEPHVANADRIGGSQGPYKFLSKVTFQCQSGYAIKGGDTQICDEHGHWLPGLPTCEDDGHTWHLVLCFLAGFLAGILVTLLVKSVMKKKRSQKNVHNINGTKESSELQALSFQ